MIRVAQGGADGRLEDLAPALKELHKRQEANGHLGEADVSAVAKLVGTSATELFGAIASYPRFHFDAAPSSPLCCNGPACVARGAATVAAALESESATHCLGYCDQPVAVLTKDGLRVASPEAPHNLVMPSARAPVIGVAQSAFFGDDPGPALTSLWQQHDPDDLVAAVDQSGLQGRGGAGFPAGKKWRAVRAASGSPKYVICNADESEPGAFKDRCLLQHQPKRVLLGMAVAARAVGASRGVIYLRHGYTGLLSGLQRALADLRKTGLLGDPFDVVVRRGAGAYICGEETALLNSLEGRRPVPRERPPYPTTAGLFGSPTLVHNVETLAAVPAIVTQGAGEYDANRNKLYCVSGDAEAPGVFELPLGITARQLLDRAQVDLGRLKAFTLGGLSGGLLGAEDLDLPLDYEQPRRRNARLGSGAVIAISDQRCVVRFAWQALRFFASESCGKCAPCRIGTTRLAELLSAAVELRRADTSALGDIAQTIAIGAACGLGPAAGLIVHHLVANFESEVREHAHGTCRTGECHKS